MLTKRQKVAAYIKKRILKSKPMPWYSIHAKSHQSSISSSRESSPQLAVSERASSAGPPGA